MYVFRYRRYEAALVVAISIFAVVPASTSGLGFAPRGHWSVDAEDAAATAESPANGTQHAAVVALVKRGVVACTGTLVAPNVVLTARHCVGVTRAHFGQDPDKPQVVRAIAGTRISLRRGVDLALLGLEHPVNVLPLDYRSAPEVRSPERIRIVGYGQHALGGPRARWRQILDVTMSGWGCRSDNWHRMGCHPDFEMVLPRRNAADTCRGDSGGPVLERTGTKWKVVAVTSRGTRNSHLLCGDGGIYTRIAPFSVWLRKNVVLLSAEVMSRRAPNGGR